MQGGYLQGNIQLPKDVGDLRIVFSTVADKPMALDEELCQKYPGVQNVGLIGKVARTLSYFNTGGR